MPRAIIVAKHSRNAKKAALLASLLMFGRTVIWFLSSMATALMGVDLADMEPVPLITR